jgi:hypothetical protein
MIGVPLSFQSCPLQLALLLISLRRNIHHRPRKVLQKDLVDEDIATPDLPEELPIDHFSEKASVAEGRTACGQQHDTNEQVL